MASEANDLKRVSELHNWNKRVLVFGGMWPLDRASVKFYTGTIYFVIHMFMTLSDLLNVFGDISLVIANFLETSTQLMIAAKMLSIRYSPVLRDVLEEVLLGSKAKRYASETEKKLYLSYTAIGRFFFQAGSSFAIMTIFLLFLRPFEDIAKAVFYNETIVYVLPCRMKLYFDITDARVYALAYLWQCPLLYFYYFHTTSTCFICSLVVHVAGDLSILAHRIRQINSDNATENYRDPGNAFRTVLFEHRKIISTATEINDIFTWVLLVELLLSTVLMGLTCYNVLAKSLKGSTTDFFFVVNYSMAILTLVLVYCLVGDYLIRESMNVHDAFYECIWYNTRSRYHKELSIFMSRARRPLQLTAGQFYVFSLPQFTIVLKSAMAYISMLRETVQ